VREDTDTEAVLIERARRGDAAAFGELVRRNQQVAFRSACLICDPAEAEDATQEAFVRAWRALDRFRPGAPFRPWLLAILANEARSRRRSHGRREALARRAALEPAPESAPAPEAAAERREREAMLAGALARMPEHERRAIVGRYVVGLDEGELATVLDCRRGTIKSRLSRGREHLRELVEVPVG
jgi:RNA polymerase sigma-70 factor (ECF subfamily)